MNKTKEEQVLHTPVFDVVKKSFDSTDFQPVGLNCKPWAMVIAVDDSIDKNPVTVFVEQTRWGLERKTIEFPCGTVEAEDFFTAILEEQAKGNNVSEEAAATIGHPFVKPTDFIDGAQKTPVDITKWTPGVLGQAVYDRGIAIAAAREFTEETGIDVLPEQLFKIAEFNPNPAYFQNTMSIFYIKKADLLERFNNKKAQELDKDEDCRVFCGRFQTYVPSVRQHAMGIAALFFAESAEKMIESKTLTQMASTILKTAQVQADPNSAGIYQDLSDTLGKFKRS